MGLRTRRPNPLMRGRWRRDNLKKGDVIFVSGSPTQKTVRFADGSRVFNAAWPGGAGIPGAPVQ